MHVASACSHHLMSLECGDAITIRVQTQHLIFYLVIAEQYACSIRSAVGSPRLAYPLMKEAGIQNLQYLSIGYVVEIIDVARSVPQLLVCLLSSVRVYVRVYSELALRIYKTVYKYNLQYSYTRLLVCSTRMRTFVCACRHILVHDAARIGLIGDGAHYATNLLFKTQRSVDEVLHTRHSILNIVCNS